MVIRSSGKFLKYLSKMLNINYNKCQKDLRVTKSKFRFFKKKIKNSVQLVEPHN